MKASRFSDAQKAFILKQGSGGMPVTESAARQERTCAAADGIDDGATFVEGRDLGDLVLAMSPDVFGRLLSLDDSAALLDSLAASPLIREPRTRNHEMGWGPAARYRMLYRL